MLDLFDFPDTTAIAQFNQAFDTWAQRALAEGKTRQPSSQASYRTIWNHFSKWCLSQSEVVYLDRVVAADIERYALSLHHAHDPSATASSRHIWRVLHTIERILSLYNRLEGHAPNPSVAQVLDAHPQWRYAQAAQHTPLPENLPPDQARILVNYLTGQRSPIATASQAKRNWQDSRNRCSVALQLGAGLTPSDVRALQVESVISSGGPVRDLPWKLVVPQHGSSAERQTPLARWSAHLLHEWLRIRQEQGLAGNMLFPATAGGKPWGKVAQFGAVAEVLQASGIDKHLVSGGSFRLRHTFALRQLRKGHAPIYVARWMGIKDPGWMSRYQQVVYKMLPDLA